MASSTLMAERGHEVHLFEAEKEIGGQFNMAKVIPGKEDYAETIRYFNRQIELTGVNLKLNTRATAEDIIRQDFDEVILCTGVTPRKVDFPGSDDPRVLDYAQVLYENAAVGNKVAIVGAGGIGFDMAEFLAHQGESPSQDIELYMKEWGVDMDYAKGGSLAESPLPEPSAREIYLLKRSKGKHGKTLGKTTGWIHRSSLAMKKVNMIGQVVYDKFDDEGLHIVVGEEKRVLDVDNIIICAGQEPLNDLQEALEKANIKVHLIGGSKEAAELDAKRAINEASYLAASI